MGDKDTQLPADLKEEIRMSAMAFAAGMWPGETKHDEKQREYVAAVHEAGAAEYAINLHRAMEYLNLLLSAQLCDLKAPDHLINEIKTFLDGK